MNEVFNVLRCLDKNEYYRFFVDGRFHKSYSGWIGYENKEKNSIKGLYNGLFFVLDNFNLLDKLDVSFICLLHKVVMGDVLTKFINDSEKEGPGIIRTNESGFKVFKCSRDGLNEIIEFSKYYNYGNIFFDNFNDGINKNHDVDFILSVQDKRKYLVYRPFFINTYSKSITSISHSSAIRDESYTKKVLQKKIVTIMQEILDEYNNSIDIKLTPEKKLLCIAKLVKKLELLHPFSDGNCRTFATVLLNGLLLKNELHPTFLENPNYDADYSYEEFSEEIRKGQEKYLMLIKKPMDACYDFKTPTLSKEVLTENGKLIEPCFNKVKEIFLAQSDRADSEPLIFDLVDLKDFFPGSIRNLDDDVNMVFSKIGRASIEATDGVLYVLGNYINWKKNGYTMQKVLAELYKKGVGLVMVENKDVLDQHSKITYPYLQVDDVMDALSTLSQFVRSNTKAKRVLVTGSVGKTGFKLQLNHLLKKYCVTHVRQDSANMNLPIATEIISIKASYDVHLTEVAVGTGGGLGAYRSSFVEPHVAVITQLSQCHMDGHKTIEGLVKHKASVTKPMKGGYAIINGDMDLAYPLKNEINSINPSVEVLTFGSSSCFDAQLLSKEFDSQSLGWKVKARIEQTIVDYFVPLLQSHAPVISLGVLLAAKKLNYDVSLVSRQYSSFNPYKTMGAFRKLNLSIGEVYIYDQSRRGAIEGMRSALDDYRRLCEIFKPARRVACIGSTSMYSDSIWTKEQHSEIGEMINQSAIQLLYTVGKFNNYIHEKLINKSILMADAESCSQIVNDFKSQIKPGDFIFVMGHGRLSLDKLVSEIEKL